MPYVKRVPKPHQCPQPDDAQVRKDDIGAGTIWQCEQCNTRWVYVIGLDGDLWEKESDIIARRKTVAVAAGFSTTMIVIVLVGILVMAILQATR